MLKALIAILSAVALVHSWYDQSCCSENHCHPVPCEEISIARNGDYLWRHGSDQVRFGRSAMKPSLDEGCHVCVLHNAIEGGVCIYLPPRV